MTENLSSQIESESMNHRLLIGGRCLAAHVFTISSQNSMLLVASVPFCQ